MSNDHYSKYVTDKNLIGRYSEYQDKYKQDARKSDLVTIDLVRQALGGLDKGRVLDIACSTGNFLRHLRHAMPSLQLVGADLARELVEKCRADKDLSSISFAIADLLDLSPLGRFNAITANAVTYLLEWSDYHKAIASIYAALEPGGTYIGFELNNPFSIQDLTIIETNEWNPNGLTLRIRSLRKVKEALQSTGFKDVTFHEFTMPIDLPFPGYDADVVTYTRKDQHGKRLSFRGAVFQPWYHIVATKPV